jgi:zinc transport system permease protein
MLTIMLGIFAISFLLAPVGCVLLWQRYNYFSDGLAHASIFSGIVSYFLDLPQILSMMLISTAFVIIIYLFKFLSNRNNVVTIVSTAFVASAIIIAGKLEDKSVINVMLFGDMIGINYFDLSVISILGSISLILLILFQKNLVLIALDRDLAKVQGVRVDLIEFISLILFGLVIALTVKIVGALLITALLVTPAAAARLISNTPMQMVISALLIAIISGIVGLILSFGYDLPLSSAIVIVCIIIYGLMNLAVMISKGR